MRFSQEFRGNFPYQVGDRFEAYIQTIHPYTLNNVELYWSGGWKEDEVEPLQMLVERYPRKVIQKGDDFTIEFVSLANKREYLDACPKGNFKTSDRYQGFDFPDRSFTDVDIRDPVLRRQLLEWAANLFRLRFLKKLTVNYLSDLLDIDQGVNTPGQLFRVWPEAGSVMHKRYSGRVMGQKLQSALPHEFMQRTSIEEFRGQPYFHEINTHLLALSVLDCKEQESYPYMY